MEHIPWGTVMYKEVRFNFEGKQAGKARPRVTRRGTYTPKPQGFETLVTEYAVVAMNEQGCDRFERDVPVFLHVMVTRQMPKGWSKKKKAEYLRAFAPHTPDLVNIVASCMDGMNGVVYEDDRQVSYILASQRWGTEYRTEIRVNESCK